jgi:DsbC/DsbD-like thiol-disulfide interchange protein
VTRSRAALALYSLAALAAADLAAAPARALASDWAENPESRVRLVTPYRVAPREAEVWLGVHFRLTPEWHVYWKNSGDAGFPPAIGAEQTPELSGVELLWPAPERYELPGDLVAFGYGDEVVYPVRAQIAAAGRDRVAIALRVDYLVCQIDCVPYGYTLRLDQPVGARSEPDPETAPLIEHWRARVPVAAADLPGIETRGRLDFGDLRRPVLTVTVDGAHAAPGHRPEIFLEAHDRYDPGPPELAESPSGLRFQVPFDLLQRLGRAPASAELAWTVTGLAAPAALAERAARGDGSIAIDARQTVPAGAGAAATSGGRSAVSVPGLLFAALAGGLVLALTPGALALVLLLAGSLRHLAANRPAAVLSRGLAAAAGALAAGLALAGADLATAGGGWSRLLQGPLAVAALAVVTLLFALGLWGLLGRGDRTGGNAAPEAGAPTASTALYLAAGALLPVLALPWAVPPAATSLDRAAGLGAGVGLAAALLAALGLALPVLAAAFVVRGRPPAPRATPRRRPAGDRTEALGFLALVSLLWLLYVLAGRLDAEPLAGVELCLLGLGLAAWGRRSARRPAARRTWSVLVAVAAAAALWLAAVG